MGGTTATTSGKTQKYKNYGTNDSGVENYLNSKMAQKRGFKIGKDKNGNKFAIDNVTGQLVNSELLDALWSEGK